MDTKRLGAFINVADVGSVTRAVSLLHVAQPALSQQIVALEAEFRQQLLIRSTRGVVPTEAGRTLYRHAQAILRQLDEAQLSLRGGEPALPGHVKVGLAPFSIATIPAFPLLRQVRLGYPGIVLHIRDYFGAVLRELVLGGQLDIAMPYGIRPVRGLRLQRLLGRRVVPGDDVRDARAARCKGAGGDRGARAPRSAAADQDDVPAQHRRGGVRASGLRARCRRRVGVAGGAGRRAGEGMGSTILSWSMATAVRNDPRVDSRRIGSAALKVTMSPSAPEVAPLSDAAPAVDDLLAAEVQALIARWPAPPHDAG